MILKIKLRRVLYIGQEVKNKMPTRENLQDSLRVQFKLGLSDNQYYCTDHSQEPIVNRNYNNPTKSTGKEIGKMIYYPDTDEMIFKPNSGIPEKE